MKYRRSPAKAVTDVTTSSRRRCGSASADLLAARYPLALRGSIARGGRGSYGEPDRRTDMFTGSPPLPTASTDRSPSTRRRPTPDIGNRSAQVLRRMPIAIRQPRAVARWSLEVLVGRENGRADIVAAAASLDQDSRAHQKRRVQRSRRAAIAARTAETAGSSAFQGGERGWRRARPCPPPADALARVADASRRRGKRTCRPDRAWAGQRRRRGSTARRCGGQQQHRSRTMPRSAASTPRRARKHAQRRRAHAPSRRRAAPAVIIQPRRCPPRRATSRYDRAHAAARRLRVAMLGEPPRCRGRRRGTAHASFGARPSDAGPSSVPPPRPHGGNAAAARHSSARRAHDAQCPAPFRSSSRPSELPRWNASRLQHALERTRRAERRHPCPSPAVEGGRDAARLRASALRAAHVRRAGVVGTVVVGTATEGVRSRIASVADACRQQLLTRRGSSSSGRGSPRGGAVGTGPGAETAPRQRRRYAPRPASKPRRQATAEPHRPPARATRRPSAGISEVVTFGVDRAGQTCTPDAPAPT